MPQTVSSASSLFSITLGGTAYTYSEGSAFTYVPGKQHNFTVTVDKKADGGYNVTVQTTISAWTNDNSSHEFTAKEYVVVNVETPGTLGETLTAAGKNPNAIKYLKVLGTVNADDFYFMRDNMSVLQGVNMQETKVVEGKIPDRAFEAKELFSSFVFPDGHHQNDITAIGDIAFDGTSLTGFVSIPEGVLSIGDIAFHGTRITQVSFPETLNSIGSRAFLGCDLLTSLSLPRHLIRIEESAFAGCKGISGSLILPDSLIDLGVSAFEDCFNISGKLVIPSKITEIPSTAFFNCNKLSGLILHDGILKIGSFAFNGCSGMKGELRLPTGITSIGSSAFGDCGFSGSLILPESLITLSSDAFGTCNSLTGTIVLPESMRYINSGVFGNCSRINGIVIPSGIEVISDNAFSGCTGITSIVCLAENPPTLMNGVFDGVSKDGFTIEVPESSINEYYYASGWNEFQRIAAHREFSINRLINKTLNLEESHTFILRAESGEAWSIESKPDWVTISPASGTGKTDVTITVNSLAQGSGNREGEVVFLLDGKDYRSTLRVEQYDYSYGDGSVLTKQTHSKGSGIPLVFLGDCYDAADIASGNYLADTEEAMGYFFDIEPYKTYKDYFDVYIVFGKSEDSGVGSVNTIRESKFGTQYDLTGGSLINGGAEVFTYAKKADPNMDITKCLVVMVLNSTDYGGVTHMWNDGSAIALCPKSTDPYPYDFRGLVQHEAGGHGFGKLADEYIYVNAFIDACSCNNEHLDEFRAAKANGWYKNLSETANRDEVPWSHLMYHPSYSNTVDIYEGGFFHTRGIFRSEPNSCMNNNIPYYSAISRQAIVERIMDYAGVPFNLDDFYANDAAAINTRSSVAAAPAWVPNSGSSTNFKHHHPIIMGDHPVLK